METPGQLVSQTLTPKWGRHALCLETWETHQRRLQWLTSDDDWQVNQLDPIVVDSRFSRLFTCSHRVFSGLPTFTSISMWFVVRKFAPVGLGLDSYTIIIVGNNRYKLEIYRPKFVLETEVSCTFCYLV